MPRPAAALRPEVARPYGVSVRLDLVSVALLALAVWPMALWLYPALAPELAALAYWLMALSTALGMALGIALRAGALLLAAHALGVARSPAGVEAPGHGLTLLLFGPVLHTEARATPPVAAIGVAFVLALAQLVLVPFYLIAGYPLDGGRYLRAALLRHGEAVRVTRWVNAWRVLIALAMLGGAVLSAVGGEFALGAVLAVAGALVLSARAR